MLLLCRLLHSRPVDDEDVQPYDRRKFVARYTMLDFAILVDKYQCAQVVTHYADAALGEYRQASGVHWWTELAAAAYLLDQPKHFKAFTRDMMITREIYRESELEESEARNVLPYEVIPLLKEQHDTALVEFSSRISSLVDMVVDIPYRIGDTENNYLPAVLDALRRAGVWPLSIAYSCSLFDILIRLKNVQMPTFTTITTHEIVSATRKKPRTTHSLKQTHELVSDNDERIVVPAQNTVDDIYRTINDTLCTGLCLDCIKYESNAEGCRTPHTMLVNSFGRSVQVKWGVKDAADPSLQQSLLR